MAEEITCGEHGKARATFVCRHLVSESSGLGFNYSYDETDPDATCPEAWCNECDRVWTEAGDFSAEVAAFVDIKLVCDRCYTRLRERNWLQDERQFEHLLEESIEYLQERQARTWKQFQIDQWQRWDWDQSSGKLVFSHKGQPKVSADFVFVGSVSRLSNTWLWSWANPTNEEPGKALMRRVRAYGEENRFLKLAGAQWNADEHDGWQMTAIAARLLEAVGAYRTPSDSGFSFMILTHVNWVE
jgi:hypothetical protein